MTWITAGADEDDTHALLAQPLLGMADEGRADSGSLGGRIDAEDVDLADASVRVDDTSGGETDCGSVTLSHPRRHSLQDRGDLGRMVRSPIVAMEASRQLGAQDVVH